MRKAQGLSLNYVVVGIIAVVVLVVIIMIFTGGMQPVGEEAENIMNKTCETMGGTWQDSCENGRTVYPTSSQDVMSHQGSVCCVVTTQ